MCTLCRGCVWVRGKCVGTLCRGVVWVRVKCLGTL